jgi:hypothetical protein
LARDVKAISLAGAGLISPPRCQFPEGAERQEDQTMPHALSRRDFFGTALAGLGLAAVAATAVAATARPARAHHGWRWTADGNFELTGIIRETRLGNPHGILTVEANGEMWTVEVGQPWRNQRVGLTSELMAPGREVTVSGGRAADEAEKKVKAERVYIDGQLYDLYPGRD